MTTPERPSQPPPAWLEVLNEQQLRAVVHPGGPLLVIAGAGTGKTRTLVYRVAWLLRQGVPAERVLLLTFTRRAAREMLNRAHALCRQSTSQVWGGTFHAVGNRLLRLYGNAVGLGPGFTVADESDSADMLGLIRTDLGYSSKEKRFPRKATIRSIYSRVVNSRDPLGEVLEREYPWCVEAERGLRQIFSRYTALKQERQVLDFDDLLLFWKYALDVPEVRDRMGGQFDHVLVDEYQDTNVIQAEILQGLRHANANVTAVGDDAQSIYSFRGATIRNILEFPERFPNTTIVTLEENYRSVQHVLDVANSVMEVARFRYTKNLWSKRRHGRQPVLITCMDEAEQARVVCDAVLEGVEQGSRLQDQAVLFRAGHHSDLLEIELARRSIPFHKYGGLKFVETAHVKDLVAFLRILENPHDDMSWFRVLEMVDGVGPKTVRRILDFLRESGLDFRHLAECPVPAAARAGFAGLVDVLVSIRGEKMPLAGQIERIRDFYDPVLERLYDNPIPRRRDLDQLETIARRYRSRASFVAELALDPPQSTADLSGPPHKDEDFLILSTMHSAKGCEWKSVYIIHAADGMIPSDMATDDEASIEEERRLFYVAITRAMDSLSVVFPLRYYHRKHRMGDAHTYAQLTRFMPERTVALFEQQHIGYTLPDDRAARSLIACTDADIRTRISEFWQDGDDS
ncbi:MAG: ATP-dependent helicase [candidate division WOR-3 bacterium]|nr:MAG: ATP-dependent helicase [candidate division WOR-3 bacterium]